jgi:hypothetical protein
MTDRSDLLRHAMYLLEAEDLAQRLASLLEAGDSAYPAQGIAMEDAAGAVHDLIDAPGYEPSATAIHLVRAVVGEPTPLPRERPTTSVLEQLGPYSDE